jgi:hypothetical protein
LRIRPKINTVKKTRTASVAVTITWLATVNEYGSRPSQLENSTKVKSENTSGKKRIASCPALASIMSATKVKSCSEMSCMRVGTRRRCAVGSSISAITATTLTTISRAELVKPKWMPPTSPNGTMSRILNWWMGSIGFSANLRSCG